MAGPAKTINTVIPTLRYRDARAAIDWLCQALGFVEHLVVEGENDTIVHAQLTFGNGMIMLGSDRDDEFSTMQRPLESSDAVASQSAYLIVTEIEAHYAHAKSMGATIVTELCAQQYGGKFYACRDPQNQLWNIGSYDPWAK